MRLPKLRALSVVLVVLVVLASALATACSDEPSTSGSSGGGSSSSGGTATLPDACTLISAAEIESLLGEPTVGVSQTAQSPGGDLRRCTWKRKYSAVLRNDEIVISVAQAAAYSPTGPSAIVGAVPYAIGDEGQLLDQSRGLQAAWKKGALSASYRYSVVGAFTDDFEPLRARAKELAQAANGRM
jgi:hypothetical protein